MNIQHLVHSPKDIRILKLSPKINIMLCKAEKLLAEKDK